MDNTDLHMMVGRIDANVQSLLARELTAEKRIASLETSRAKAWGALAVLVPLGSFVSTVALTYIKSFFA
jgi:hypothetical protein